MRCLEILNYTTYDQGMIVFDVMGFGKPMDDIPMLLEPGILTMAWGSVVHQIAAGLGVELDEVEEFYERLPGDRVVRHRQRHASRRAPSRACASRSAARSAARPSSCSST